MALSRNLNIMTDAFLDGITGAALFGKLKLPGSPTVFVDARSPEEAYPEYDALLNAEIRAGAPQEPIITFLLGAYGFLLTATTTILFLQGFHAWGFDLDIKVLL